MDYKLIDESTCYRILKSVDYSLRERKPLTIYFEILIDIPVDKCLIILDYFYTLYKKDGSKLLRKLTIASLGSKYINQVSFTEYVVLEIVRKFFSFVNNLEEAHKIIKFEFNSPRHYDDYTLHYLYEAVSGALKIQNASHVNIAVGHVLNDIISVSCNNGDYLNLCGEIVLNALIKFNSPGCKYLYLCDPIRNLLKIHVNSNLPLEVINEIYKLF